MADLPFINLDDEDDLPFINIEGEDELPLIKLGDAPRTKKQKEATATAANRLRTWGKGAMLGFQDEAEGLFGALFEETEANKIAREIEGSERTPYLERAKQLTRGSRDSQKQYAEDNPWEAGALEIAGAVMSPVNRVAPGLGRSGGALSRAAQLGGRGAAEGAVYGFGEGEGGIGSRLDSAEWGAKTGGAGGFGLSLAGGAVGRAFSKRRVDADMTNLKTAPPLHMAAPDSSLGKFYRNVVGLGFGGGGRLGKQESRYLNASRKMARFADESGEVAPVTAGTRRSVENIKKRARDRIGVEKDSLTDMIEDVRGREAPRVPPKPTKAAVAAEVDSRLSKTVAKMQRDQAMASLPKHAPGDVVESVKNAANPLETVSQLDKYWKSSDAFRGVKEHLFDLDDGLYNLIKRGLDPVADAAKLESLDALKAAGGKIKGTTIMAMRNQPLIGKGTVSGMAYGKARQSAKKWDRQIERQLKAAGRLDALKQFRADKGTYGNYRAYEGAASKASARGDIGASFTEKDLWKSGGNKTQRTRGKAPGQDRAREVIKERIGLTKTLKAQAEQARSAAEASAEAAKKSKDSEISRLRNRLKREGQRETAAINRINRETAGMLPEDSTVWSRLAATAAMGAPLSGFSAGGSIPVGIAVSTALASPRVQRFLAGQGPTQDALRKALENGDTALVTQILARIGAMEGTEQGNQQ